MPRKPGLTDLEKSQIEGHNANFFLCVSAIPRDQGRSKDVLTGFLIIRNRNGTKKDHRKPPKFTKAVKQFLFKKALNTELGFAELVKNLRLSKKFCCVCLLLQKKLIFGTRKLHVFLRYTKIGITLSKIGYRKIYLNAEYMKRCQLVQ